MGNKKNWKPHEKRLYSIYYGMKQRCGNPHNISYKNYGARGISVCVEWSDFKTFYEWALSNGYSDGLTIERKDINKGYSPENCCWIPLSDQLKNTRQNYVNKTLTVNGITKTYQEWADSIGITPRRLYRRLQRGMSPEVATSQPNNQRGHQITINGETHNVTEWCKIYGIERKTYSERRRHGLSEIQSITLPKKMGVHHTARKDEKS